MKPVDAFFDKALARGVGIIARVPLATACSPASPP
jgi:hypothetical protein